MAIKRKKVPCIVLSFATTSNAMAMDAAGKNQQIPGRLIPIPSEISAGCGFGWKIGVEEYKEYENVILGLGIEIEKTTEIML